MKYISEDGTVYKSKKDYWMTLYPIRENETTPCYIRRIKKKLYPEYLETIIKHSREYHKNKYNNDEEYKEYKKNTSLKRYYIKKINIKEEN